jgi:uncharacterized Zn-finger protein
MTLSPMAAQAGTTRRFGCPLDGCGYTASQRRYIKDHLRTHTGERPFRCSWDGCTYASASSGHLTRHLRTHTGERPYECPVEGCRYAATQSGHLQDHIRRTHAVAKAEGGDEGGCRLASPQQHLLPASPQHTPGSDGEKNRPASDEGAEPGRGCQPCVRSVWRRVPKKPAAVVRARD